MRQAAFALALLLGLQPVTTDLYLPALPALTRSLGASMSAAQQTMAALLLAFGIGQLMWGPVSDRIGRRPVLLIGLTLYTAAGFGAAMASHIGWLIGWRTLQGLGLAASVVCARALVRDLYEPVRGAQVMAYGMSGLGLLAVLSPSVGGLVAGIGGWRLALATVGAVGAVALACVMRWLPETHRRRGRAAASPRALARAWLDILRHRDFIAWSLLMASTFGGLFTMLAASSFVFIDVLGVAPALYGVAIGSASAAYIGGTFVCRHWIRHHGLAGAVRRGAWFTLAGGLVMVVPVLLGMASAWTLVVAQCLYGLGHGIHQPCGQAGAVGPFPERAGVAAALSGFGMAATAFGVGVWLGASFDRSPGPMAQGVAFWSLMTTVVAWTLVQRLAPPRPAAAHR